jgi:hypothetical protein
VAVEDIPLAVVIPVEVDIPMAVDIPVAVFKNTDILVVIKKQ